MSVQLTPFTVDVHLVDGIPKTTSINVAQVFGKRHDHVLRSIRELECSNEFRAPNFGEGSYLDAQGQSRPMYEMTRDGFTFLAMGFTGKEAARWKEAYIAAFNAMAEQFARPAPAVSDKPLTPAEFDRLLEVPVILSGSEYLALLSGQRRGKRRTVETASPAAQDKIRRMADSGSGATEISIHTGLPKTLVEAVLGGAQ